MLAGCVLTVFLEPCSSALTWMVYEFKGFDFDLELLETCYGSCDDSGAGRELERLLMLALGRPRLFGIWELDVCYLSMKAKFVKY